MHQRSEEDVDNGILWRVYPLLVALLGFLFNPLPLVPIVQMCAILFSFHLMWRIGWAKVNIEELR